jgi:hypothetical protein
MTKTERRHHRSEKEHLALNYFLESVKQKEGLEALAVTTEDGLLVAGAGNTDLEWMGAVGASCRRATLAWDEHMLFIQRVQVNQMTMFLTSAGRPANGNSVQSGLERILAG